MSQRGILECLSQTATTQSGLKRHVLATTHLPMPLALLSSNECIVNTEDM